MYQPQPNDFCVDCGVDTISSHEYYMVHDSVWDQTGLDKHGGMLCVSCLEARIGRTLNYTDFTDALVNKSSFFIPSPKLEDRRTRL